jgi:hypothetical protein
MVVDGCEDPALPQAPRARDTTPIAATNLAVLALLTRVPPSTSVRVLNA